MYNFSCFVTFFTLTKKYFVFQKFVLEKQTTVLFFFSAALFIELERLIDAQELPKNGDGLTKPGRFDFCGVLLLHHSSIVAKPAIRFFFCSLW